jgi:hypothetical protein
MCDLHYVTDYAQDDMSLCDDDIDSYFSKSDEERATDTSTTTHSSDAYVCEGWDEPNYISAGNGYYPDLSECQSDVDTSSDREGESDEQSTTTLCQYLDSLRPCDREKAEKRMAKTRARIEAILYKLDGDSDDN